MQEKSLLIKKAALELGFNDVRFAAAKPLIEEEKKFLKWRELNLAADMDYLLRDNPINARPENLLENAKSIIIMTANYYSPCPDRPSNDHGRVAAYATGLDYHKVLRKKGKLLAKKFQEIFQNSKFFTDAVPLLEKSFAIKAGLGFRGNNTLLISKETGSYNFIMEFITDIEFEPDSEFSSATASCGNCTRCIDICPTAALINKQQIDAGLCISYLTIENKGLIEENLRPGIGEWLFGCDLCQEICPYNKAAERRAMAAKKQLALEEFNPENGVGHWIYLPEMLSMDKLIMNPDKYREKFMTSDHFISEKNIDPNMIFDQEFDQIYHQKYCKVALSRPKRFGLIRNALITAANLKSQKSFSLVEKYTNHENEILKETAKWALKQY